MTNPERDDYREPETTDADPNPRYFRIAIGLLFIGVVLFYWLISLVMLPPITWTDYCLIGVSGLVFISGIVYLKKGITEK